MDPNDDDDVRQRLQALGLGTESPQQARPQSPNQADAQFSHPPPATSTSHPAALGPLLFSQPGVRECLQTLTTHQAVAVLGLAIQYSASDAQFSSLVQQLSSWKETKEMPPRVNASRNYPSLPKKILEALLLVRLPAMTDMPSTSVRVDPRTSLSIPHPVEAQDEDSAGVHQNTRSR